MSVNLKGCKQQENAQAITNCAFVDELTFNDLYTSGANKLSIVDSETIRCDINGFILNVKADLKLPMHSIACNGATRACARVPLDKPVLVKVWSYTNPQALISKEITFAVTPIKPLEKHVIIKSDDLVTFAKTCFANQVMTLNQCVYLEAANHLLLVGHVRKIENSNQGPNITSSLHGLIKAQETSFVFTSEVDQIMISGGSAGGNALFKENFNFEELGIGGLDKEFEDIFRRAFASRVYSAALIQELGITHVRGLLLFGPPGTGKTLIARQIGKALRAKEPKVVNGPEVLNKFVGQSEENIRNLFADAEADQKKYGANSPLHIIIFDELDAICKQRGSTASGTGVNDSVVNQLLSKIDGVNALDNILLIGMTNRLDMLDEALLRPGRLEVQIEIGLPDEQGREQILKIHTNKMRESSRIAKDVSLERLAAATKNYSGAELAGLIRSAVSYAFARNVDPKSLKSETKLSAPDESKILITQADFQCALDEIKPAFGADTKLDSYALDGIIPFSSELERLQSDLFTLSEQVRSKSPLVSVLLYGAPGSGKTSLAVEVAKKSQFPFVKIISSANFVGYGELQKLGAIAKTFDDSYRSNLSCLIIDDIERILDFTPIGPRFSNPLLQTLLVLLKKVPPQAGRRLLIIGTTSEPNFIEDSKLASAFQLAYKQPLIRDQDAFMRCVDYKRSLDLPISQSEARKLANLVYETGSVKLGVKKLFLSLEMATEMCKPEPIIAERALQCLRDFGVAV